MDSKKFLYKKFRETHLFAFLNQFEQDGMKPLDAALSDYLRAHKSIGAHDRRDLSETIYALIRWKGLLTYLGASSWEKRYVLWQRIDLRESPEIPLWARSGSSEWLFQELTHSYDEAKAAELCRILNEPAPLTIRANGLKISRDELLSLFQKRFEVASCERSHWGIRFRERIALTSLLEYKQGLFEIQDEGSQILAALVKAAPGDQVLDFCAGSGGKSLGFAPYLGGRGQIYLHDIRPSILEQARKRLRRAGVQNAQFLPPNHPRLATLKNKMDWVLADVPCSGSGTYRRNPDMKWKINEALLERLVQEQRVIFAEACAFVKPGGRIVYATCSLFTRENQAQVDYFLASLPLGLETAPLSILPAPNGPDGFFAAVFYKK